MTCDHQSVWAEYWRDNGGYWVAVCHRCGASGLSKGERSAAIKSFGDLHGGTWEHTGQNHSGADREGHCDGYDFAHRLARVGSLDKLPEVLRAKARWGTEAT